MVIREELADGIIMIGVRDTRLVGPVEGRGWATAVGATAVGAAALRGWVPSVTDFSVIPWYVPVVSILKPSVSNNSKKIFILLFN